MTKISEVNITLIKPKEGLIGFASCVVDDKWYFGNIGIYTCLEGEDYRLTYPTKKLKNGQNMNTVHPINQEAEQAVKKAIIDKITEIIN